MKFEDGDAEEQYAESKNRVLIVHHDERALMNLEHRLEVEEFDTATVGTTKEAVLAVDQAAFDIVLIGDRPPLITASEIICYMWRAGHAQRTFIVTAGDSGFVRAAP